MRVKDKVRIAFWNLGAGKQMMKKMIFGMVFVFMIIFCFFDGNAILLCIYRRV